MKVITIGRSNEGNDVIIDDPWVSRHHFQIVQDDNGSFRLADFGSTNGTYINGQKVSGEVELDENDIIRVGNTIIPWRQYFDADFGGYGYVEPKQRISSSQTSNETLIEKQRHWFVTFWLVIMIIANIAGGIMQILSANYAIWQYATEEKAKLFFFVEHGMVDYYTYVVYFMVVLSIINVVGASLLLNWKKVGYWLFVGSASACLVIMISFAIFGGVSKAVLSSLMGAVLGPIVLWAILQIKEKGFSCWKQME